MKNKHDDTIQYRQSRIKKNKLERIARKERRSLSDFMRDRDNITLDEYELTFEEEDTK